MVGVMVSIAGLSTQPHVTEALWWRGMLGFGILLMLVGFYGFLSLVFPVIGPRPQMLQDKMLWTAKRYRDFAEKHHNETENLFLSRFWKRYPYEQLDHLGNRADSVIGKKIRWQLFTELPSSADVVKNIADHLEVAARDVPPNIPV